VIEFLLATRKTNRPNKKGNEMRFSFDEIKQELTDNWEQFESNQYPEDALGEFADSALPIYYNDILTDWQEMPSEFNDSWQEFGLPSSKTEEITIFGLMTIDLYNYYQHQYSLAYRELCDEMLAKEAN
jgi:hypothetical protein